MLNLIRKINCFLVDMFSQNENVGLVTLTGLKNEIRKVDIEKSSDTVIYNLFK